MPRNNANWPVCIKCKRVVLAYGVEHESPKVIDIYMECDHGPLRRRVREVQSIRKMPGWSMENIQAAIGMLVMGSRDVRLN